MKKLLTLSLVTLLAVLAITPSSFAADGGKHHKAKTPVHFSTDYFTNYTGSDFTNNVSSSTLLTPTTNWSTPSTTTTLSCDGSGNLLCGMEIIVPSSLPTFADILAALKTWYDSNKPFVNGNSIPLTVDGVSITVVVFLKSF